MTRPEVDFLMEAEYALEAQLDRIRARIGELLTRDGIEPTERPERHLHLVPKPEGL